MADPQYEPHTVTVTFVRSVQQVSALMALDVLVSAGSEMSLDDPEVSQFNDEWPSLWHWWIQAFAERLPEEQHWTDDDKRFIRDLIRADRASYPNADPLALRVVEGALK